MVAVGVRVGVCVEVRVGTGVLDGGIGVCLGFFVGFLVGAANMLPAEAESVFAWTGMASKHTKIRPAMNKKEVWLFIIGKL